MNPDHEMIPLKIPLKDPPPKTWRGVFDSNHKGWRHMGECAAYAYNGGYAHFCWNNRIYTVTGTDTGLLVGDIA